MSLWSGLPPKVTAQVARYPGVAMASALFVVMAVWSLLLPLFAGPDETSNYVKAAAVVRFELIGDDHQPSLQDSYFRTTIDIDRQFNAANWIPWCFAPMPQEPACDRPLQHEDPRDERPWTSVGRYPPLAFVVPGLATSLGATDLSVRVARLLGAMTCAALLGAAFGRLRRDTASAVILLVAVTPGVLFLGAVISPSGPEICAAIAAWVFVPRALDGTLDRRSDRAWLGIAGATLVVARPIGSVTLLVIVLVSMLAGPGLAGLRRAVVRLPVVSATVVVAAIGMIVWHVAVFSVHLDDPVTTGQASLSREVVTLRSLGHLPTLVSEAVGNFGWLDTPAPTLAVWSVLIMMAAVVVGGWAHSSAREHWALAAIVVAAVALSLYLDADYYRILRNFGTQGRHVAPILLGIPILAGRRWRPASTAQRVLVIGWCAVVLTCAGAALRRYSVGVRDANVFDMFHSPEWTPPLGILATLLLMAVACSLVAVVALTSDANAQCDGEAAATLPS